MKKRQSRTIKYILHQIWNERRSNWALLAELLLVSSIVWCIVDTSYVGVLLANEPMGYDYSNCYKFSIDQLDETTIGYDATHPNESEVNATDLLALRDRIRHDNDIECAAYSNNGDAFTGSYFSSRLRYDTLQVDAHRVMCEPEMLKVFRIRSVDGKSPEQLAALLKEHTIMLSERTLGDQFDIRTKIGKEFEYSDTLPRRLVAVTPVLKRQTYESMYDDNTAIVLMPQKNYYTMFTVTLSARVKENRMQGFEERMNEKIKGNKLRVGNYYISGFKSYEQIKNDTEENYNHTQRFSYAAMAFLLINVFLGLLGTFWFRTQHRFPDIGLKKVVGATNTDVALWFFTEAIMLMTIAFIPSLIIDYNIAHAELTEYYQGVTFATGRFIVCTVITYVLMLIVIALGIWFPALRAVKARPVDVLRGE